MTVCGSHLSHFYLRSSLRLPLFLQNRAYLLRSSKTKDMIQVTFYKQNGNLHFSVPEMPELEAAIKATVKKHYVKTGKKEFFFRRGIQDAANAIQSGEPRKFGTPMVEVKDPFSGVTKIMPCQEAYKLLHDVGGNYFIRQVSGNPLPPDYFNFRKC